MSVDVNLFGFRNAWYKPGRNKIVQTVWFLSGCPLLRSSLLPFSAPRRWLLRIFGARVGTGVVIKPGVRVKYPWRLTVSDYSWLGEDCWIDNLEHVSIGSNVCISQGAYLCTGNHDWSDPVFGLLVRPIHIEDGAWIGAKALISPGVSIGECAIATAGSVVTHDIPRYEIHGGNPASFVKRRSIRRSDNP